MQRMDHGVRAMISYGKSRSSPSVELHVQDGSSTWLEQDYALETATPPPFDFITAPQDHDDSSSVGTLTASTIEHLIPGNSAFTLVTTLCQYNTTKHSQETDYLNNINQDKYYASAVSGSRYSPLVENPELHTNPKETTKLANNVTLHNKSTAASGDTGTVNHPCQEGKLEFVGFAASTAACQRLHEISPGGGFAVLPEPQGGLYRRPATSPAPRIAPAPHPKHLSRRTKGNPRAPRKLKTTLKLIWSSLKILTSALKTWQ